MANQTQKQAEQRKKAARRKRKRQERQLKLEANELEQDVVFASDGTITIEAKDGVPQVQINAYTGGTLALGNFSNPVVIDTNGVKAMGTDQIPLLRDHQQGRVVGHGTPIIEASGLRMTGSLSVAGEERDAITAASNSGFKWQASVGGKIPNPRRDIKTIAAGDSVNVNGRTLSGPLHIVKAFHWKETSFVALGADEGRASAAIAAELNSVHRKKKPMNEFEKWLEASGFDSDEMSATQITELKAMFDKTNAPAPVQAEAAPVEFGDITEKAVKAALEASREDSRRLAGIERLFASYNDTSLSSDELSKLRASAECGEVSVEKAHLTLIQASRAAGQTSNTAAGSVNSNPLVLEAAVALNSGLSNEDAEACLAEAGASSEQIQAALNEASSSKWAGRGIKAIVAAACHQAGHSYYEIGDEELRCALEHSQRNVNAASGFSTVSLPGILSRFANKAMLASYAEADNGGAALQIASTTSTNDFKKFTRYRMTESGVMEKVGASGEIKHGTVREEEYENKVETYGKMLSLTRQMVRNDDLDAFLQIPRLIGRQGRHALEQIVITTLVDAPTVDGAGTDEFFHSAIRNGQEPNYANAGSALSMDSLGDAYELFLNQVDSDGKPIMIDPSILLCTNQNYVTAAKLYNDTEFRFTIADTKETVANQWKGMFRPVKSSYLHRLGAVPSEGGWYLLSAPSTDVSGIQIAFLDGKRVPTLDQAQTDFNTLGIQWRGYYDFGVALQDPRAIVKMSGAA